MSTTLILAGMAAIVLLLVMILSMATGTQTLHRISGWILGPVGVIGLCLYLWAYVPADASLPQLADGVLRSVYATCAMFLGRQDYNSIFTASPVPNEPLFHVLFWLAHLGALFVSASAVLSTLGRKLLLTLRLRLRSLLAREIILIFCLSGESVILGEDLAKGKRTLVTYVDPKVSSSLLEQAVSVGAAVCQAPYLYGEHINEKLLRRLGIRQGMRSKRLRFILLTASETLNINLASQLILHLARQRIPQGSVNIDLCCHKELDYSQLEQFEKDERDELAPRVRYDVNVFSRPELSARLLVHESPPCKVMTFDGEGRAEQNFHALILGFGEVGQHALRQIVMNGQFVGSDFRVDVIDRQAEKKKGVFARRYGSMLAAYDIRFHEEDVRSPAFYAKLDALCDTLCYIVICMNDDDLSYELTAELERYYAGKAEGKWPNILVSVCNRRYVASLHKRIRYFDRMRQVYSGYIFTQEMRDSMARAVNLNYHEKVLGVFDEHEAWANASYFSRESSRASADFIPAMLKIAGFEGDDKQMRQQAQDMAAFSRQVLFGNPGLLENLSITEHLRWNAFHYAMGYRALTFEEMEERRKRGESSLTKDHKRLLHACIIPWDDLDLLAEKEAALTGNPAKDYKGMDTQNILEIPDTLAAWEAIDGMSRGERADKKRLGIRIAQTHEDSISASAIYAKSWKEAYKGVFSESVLQGIKPGQWVKSFDGNYETGRLQLAILSCEGRDIGAGAFGPSREYEAVGEIPSLYLLPEAWGTGAAKPLMYFMLSALRCQGFKRVHLWVVPQNGRALSFYEKFGFAATGVRKPFTVGGEAAEAVEAAVGDNAARG